MIDGMPAAKEKVNWIAQRDRLETTGYNRSVGEIHPDQRSKDLLGHKRSQAVW